MAALSVFVLIRADIAERTLAKFRAEHAIYGSRVPYRPIYRYDQWSFTSLGAMRVYATAFLLANVALAAYLW